MIISRNIVEAIGILTELEDYVHSFYQSISLIKDDILIFKSEGGISFFHHFQRRI
ncbi:Uncharacterised protein [Paenibacillus macerans]|uniref:Uncharacterized protein n=1 Tax=Paenibacillus macerans TaxID=44252 RepID=A0A090ZCW3_PAEMA|nr:hypothetical protein DJ90_1585 [Paenibacillus macerans]SUA83606.1 Uncharacterised protein [Paenibacillus macerans]